MKRLFFIAVASAISIGILSSSARALPDYLGALRGGGGGADSGLRVAVDRLGNCLTTGSFSGTATVWSKVLGSAGSTDAFVVSSTNTGVVTWARRIGGLGADV